MTAKFRYLLFLVVSFCYLQSALEVNTDTIKNTWGDEYDTYIHADNTTIQHVIKIEHHSNFALLPEFFFFQNSEINNTPFVADFHSLSDTSPHKTFLKNCSLLI